MGEKSNFFELDAIFSYNYPGWRDFTSLVCDIGHFEDPISLCISCVLIGHSIIVD